MELLKCHHGDCPRDISIQDLQQENKYIPLAEARACWEQDGSWEGGGEGWQEGAGPTVAANLGGLGSAAARASVSPHACRQLVRCREPCQGHASNEKK